jgi:Sulfotransferase family
MPREPPVLPSTAGARTVGQQNTEEQWARATDVQDATVSVVAPPVMILGCGRSGTSIFGELFEHIPVYEYRSEPPFEDVMAADYGRPQAFKVPRDSDRFGAPQPGLSFPLGVMRDARPDMRFFWIVRHPLDAISSLRIGIAKDWGHHPRPPDWRDWLDRPLVAQCAHHWAFLNTAGYGQVRDVATVVRFEDMIGDPASFAAGICRSLGLDPAAFAETLAGWSERVQDSNNEKFVEAQTSRGYSRPDHSRRVGRWQENLTTEDVDLAWPVVAAAAAQFGYTRNPDGT